MYRIFADVAADSDQSGFSNINTITLNEGSSLSVTVQSTCISATKLVLAGLPEKISLSGNPIFSDDEFSNEITIEAGSGAGDDVEKVVEALNAVKDGTTTDSDFTWPSATPSPDPGDNTPPRITYSIWYPVMGAEEYWAEAPGAEMVEGDVPATETDKENPSMGGAHDAA